MSKDAKTKAIITLIVCVMLTVLVAVGSWFYIQQKTLEQKDREIEQTKQLQKNEQSEINNRADKQRQCAAAQSSDDPYYKSVMCN